MKTILERSLIGHGDSVIIKRAADCFLQICKMGGTALKRPMYIERCAWDFFSLCVECCGEEKLCRLHDPPQAKSIISYEKGEMQSMNEKVLEKWKELAAAAEKTEKISRLNLVLSLLVALLAGVVIGFLTCPTRKKIVYLGSGNGNNFVGGNDETAEDADAETAAEDAASEETDDFSEEVEYEDEIHKNYVKIK